MRSREQIIALTDLELTTHAVEFPPASSSFLRYKAKLRELLAAECGNVIASTLEYDDIHQMFHVTVTATDRPLVGSTAFNDDFDCTLCRRYTIEPQHALMAQFDGIKTLRIHLRGRLEMTAHLLSTAFDNID